MSAREECSVIRNALVSVVALVGEASDTSNPRIGRGVAEESIRVAGVAIDRITAALDRIDGGATCRDEPHDPRTVETCIAIVQEADAKGWAEPWWLVNQMTCLVRIPTLNRIMRSHEQFRKHVEPLLVALGRARADLSAAEEACGGFGATHEKTVGPEWDRLAGDRVLARCAMNEATDALIAAADEAFMLDRERQNERAQAADRAPTTVRSAT